MDRIVFPVLLPSPRRFSDQHPTLPSGTELPQNHIPDRLLNRNTIIVPLAAICSGIAGCGYLGLYPTFLVGELHFTLQEAGAAASMFGAGALLGILCGFVSDRVNQKWISMFGLVL